MDSRNVPREEFPKSNRNMTASTTAERIQRELEEFLLDPPPYCSAGPKKDFQEWAASIASPQVSVYEGGVFLLEIQFIREHPFTPRTILPPRAALMNSRNVPREELPKYNRNMTASTSARRNQRELEEFLLDLPPK